jgi:hypothetical protein
MPDASDRPEPIEGHRSPGYGPQAASAWAGYSQLGHLGGYGLAGHSGGYAQPG